MTAALETFAKVRALHDGTDSPGEKAAAMLKMQTLAGKAGMTVEEAVSTLDAPGPKPRSIFDDLFNSPEFLASQAERERERAARRAAAVTEYGGEDAVWADTAMEAALRQACAPLLGPGETWDTIYRLDGWGMLDARSKMPESVRRAVSEAWPLPTSAAEAWAEYEATEKLDSDRTAFCRDYTPHTWSEARRYIVEGLCQTLPAHSLRDIRARLSWMEHAARLDLARSWEEQEPVLTTLRADIERMGVQIRQDRTPAGNSADLSDGYAPGAYPLRSLDPGTSKPVQTGQGQGAGIQHPSLRRTNADKRRDVLTLLKANADNPGIAPLSDREIARRAGVSPQTVGNIRRSIT